jgi:hypothetical protein
MALTPQQLPTLAAYITNTPELAVLLAQGSIGPIATAMNEPAAPAYIVWRTSVNQDEIMQNGFDWTRVDNLSVGKARIWEWLFDNEANVINPAKPNVRAGIDQCWVGTAADLAVRAAVYVHCKRSATIGEKLFATGAGTTAAPSVMAFEGRIEAADIEAAFAPQG